MASNPTYTISDLAREFDLTTRAIRFDEDMGLQEVGAPSPSVPSPSAHAVIPGAASSTPASQLGLRQAVEAFERDLVQTTLVQHAHNWASAARALQMDWANLTRLAKRHGLYDKRAHRPRHSG